MNKKEIRKELVNEGMYDINNSTFICTSQEIDLIVDKLEAKINYTRCCTELCGEKDKVFICENETCMLRKCNKCGEIA